MYNRPSTKMRRFFDAKYSIINARMTEQKQTIIRLPKGFLIGAASSSHQVEGNNIHNDWWHQEQLGRVPKSGLATDHWNRFEEDFDIAKQIGLNAMRISIEWSRIEPTEGKFDVAAIAHYKRVLESLRKHGLTRMVTLFHFTLPQWVAEKDGFANSSNIQYFVRYAKLIAEELGEEIELWNTINEPEVFTYMSSLAGKWPPFAKNPLRGFKQFRNLAKAHKLAYHAIKKVLPNAQISIAKNNVYNEAYRKNNALDKMAVWFQDWSGNYWFLNMIKNEMDFIGLNYYFYHSLGVGLNGIKQKNLTGPKSDMGWRTYPKGIYHLIMELHKRYGKPVYITENGIANARDDMRQDFIRQHLEWCNKAITDGADVKGYFYWSLTDNYEWSDGYDPKFGLVEINYETQKRTIRPSAEIFKQIKSSS
ncbi:TPA: glycoside hydrolase family 1 protein [Patescibacteria group bacterium]|jgi:beta-glucosidase|nr:glycoside hydrolase family 1 protein [Patescibacteria group bacterium]